MGERVLAAFGIAASMDGVLAACLSAAPTAADSAPSTAERTGSSEKVRLRTPYQQAVAEDGRLIVLTGGDRSGQDDYLKHAFEKKFPQAKGDIIVGARDRARTDIAPPVGRTGIFDQSTLNPPSLGQFTSDRAAPDRYKARLSLCTGDVHGAVSSDPTSSASTRSTKQGTQG